MKQHNFLQGSAEWLEYRRSMFNASDAPAMLGKSPYKTRSKLLDEIATGLIKDVDAATQRIFDAGHRYEALARPLAEAIIGEDLYPVTGSAGKLSASFDGLTMGEDIAWEHKTLNDAIRNTATIDDLRIDYRIQMEQQLYVSGAEKCLFTATQWNDSGELLEEKHFWYKSDDELRQQIIEGWSAFAKAIECYEPTEIIEPPKAEAIKDLPAVTIQVKGELTTCNLDTVKPYFDKFLSEAKITLVTDNDFAQAEAEAKLGRETAKRCKLTAKAVVDQMLSISEVTRTLEEYAAKFDALALKQEKAVKEQKESRKTAAKLERDQAYATHIAALNSEISPIVLVLNQADKPDFVGAMKNQRTLESLYNKLDTELARVKIAADAVAKDIRAKLAWIKESHADYGFLFKDLQQIIYKDNDDFELLVNSRVADHKKAEADKLEAQRLQIHADEEAKAKAKIEAENDAKLNAEREKIRLEEQAKAQLEAEEKLRTEQAEKERLEREVKQANDLAERERHDRESQEMLEQAAAKKIDDSFDTIAEHLVDKLLDTAKINYQGKPIKGSGPSIEMVTIPKSEYDELIMRCQKLDCLEEAGVNNWDWYGDAMDRLKKLQAA